MTVAVWLLALLAWGCAREEGQPAAEAAVPALRSLPVEMTVKQRSTTEVPGSDGRVRVTVEDVTRGQVLVTVLAEDGSVLSGPTSLCPGDNMGFEVGGGAYVVKLEGLENTLLGEDHATLVITSAAETGPSEKEKIERLIALVGSMQDAVFIRHGAEYSAEDGAEHLRWKWEAAGDRIHTAQQFVEEIATRSSATGELYQIRLADGTLVPAGEYLKGRLAEIEGE
ncbi:MAG: DUF5329 family protein [Planctomycetes bacterium]|nr:DUF5329 family protein [Planctomycetota bacterium]